MKKSQLIAVTALTTLATAYAAIYLLDRFNKKKHTRRLATISDAGYETAWDIHYPLKYKG